MQPGFQLKGKSYSSIQTPKFNKNKVANLGVRILSQSSSRMKTQPDIVRKARGKQRIICKGGKRMGHDWPCLTTATVRHASPAVAWCWDHVSLCQNLNKLIQSTLLVDYGKYNSRLSLWRTQNSLPITEGPILSSQCTPVKYILLLKQNKSTRQCQFDSFFGIKDSQTSIKKSML